MQAFASDRLVLPDREMPGALLVEGEKIHSIVPREKIPANTPLTDFGALAILPGLVDSHIHINEPGRTEWEGFATATRGAAAGGYTLLVDMPLNCVPSTTSPKTLQAKIEAAEGQCQVDWAAWGAVVADNQDQLQKLVATGVAGFKCFLIHPGTEDFTMVGESELRAALPILKAANLPLLVHAELPAPIDAATQSLAQSDWRSYATYLASRPPEAELQAIDLLIRLCGETGCHIHVVHLSTAQALDRLRNARNRGLPLTVETCPHYLHFAAEDIRDGSTITKCAPPIRDRANREALWQALRDKTIDLIATDHSPCPPNLKHLDTGNFQTAWGGIASVSLALPVIWTEAERRGHSLIDVARWMGSEPARLAGFEKNKGSLALGHDADFVVFDPEKTWKVTGADLHFRHKISPYLGAPLKGQVLQTYLRGECVYKNGQFPNPTRGRFRQKSAEAHHN
jgi:allantoinase